MFMIDILRLPGVEQEKQRLLENGAYSNTPGVHVKIMPSYADDLIRAVAEAVERKVREELERG